MVRTILDNVLSGKELEFEEARALLGVGRDEVLYLMYVADTVRMRFCGDSIDLCWLINAKSGLCSEDCKFCAQASRYNTGCEVYGMVSVERIVEEAAAATAAGAGNFCIVISGARPTREEFARIKEAVVRVREEVGVEVDCSLGGLERREVSELKELGVRRYNHNLETSQDFYRAICTTHAYEDRVRMVRRLKDVGVDACCGGVIGMGEDAEDRIKLAFALKELDIKCVPINILNPRPGTPLEGISPPQPMEIIKTIAIFRLILPGAIIKVAGGREYGLGDFQAMAFMSGANGMIIGGYLTTGGRSVESDLRLIGNIFQLKAEPVSKPKRKQVPMQSGKCPLRG